jgi:hypothetical protein
MDFNSRMQAFIESVKVKAKDGLSLEEAFSILHDFIEMAVEAAKELGNPGAEKRAIVLQWVGTLFDVLAPLVPVPLWFKLLQPFTRPIVRQVVLALAGALLEKTYAKLKG